MATNRKPEAQPDPQVLGVTAVEPVQRQGMDRVKHFIYDPDTGAFLSRTWKSWGLIAIFYIVFYAVLAAFWFSMFQVFLTLNQFVKLFLIEQVICCYESINLFVVSIIFTLLKIVVHNSNGFITF